MELGRDHRNEEICALWGDSSGAARRRGALLGGPSGRFGEFRS